MYHVPMVHPIFKMYARQREVHESECRVQGLGLGSRIRCFCQILRYFSIFNRVGRFVPLQLFYLGTNDQYVPFLDICGPILAVLWLFLPSLEIFECIFNHSNQVGRWLYNSYTTCTQVQQVAILYLYWVLLVHFSLFYGCFANIQFTRCVAQ